VVLINEENAEPSAYVAYSGTVLFNGTVNPDDADDGYVDIILTLQGGAIVTVTNFQVLTVVDEDAAVDFQQQSVPQQENQLFYYYKPQLAYKPIKSYLTGWDFPLNPAQFGSTVAASAIGANKSQYVWDQTIVFQTADSGVSVLRDTGSGALKLTAVAATQLALVQYLDQTQARKLLNNPMSCNVSALASVATNACISLWYTTDATLPVAIAGTNNSLVLTLDANGKPATFNGVSWLEVPRGKQGDAKFTIATSSTTNFNDYPFNGWDMDGIAACNTATFFAIVVGTAAMTMSSSVTFNSISLVPGDIPTIPAPQTPDEVLRECQYYYESNYPVGTAAGGANILGVMSVPQLTYATGGNVSFITSGFVTPYTLKRVTPTVSYYSTAGTVDRISARVVTNTADSGYGELDGGTGGFWTYGTNTKYNSMTITTDTHLSANPTQPGTYGTAFIAYNFVADSRLGVVN